MGSRGSALPKPFKVTFKDISQKKHFLRNAPLLKSLKCSDLRVSHDMTLYERDLNKSLLRTAYELNRNRGHENSFVFKVRGPPWNSRIVKVSKPTQFE